MFAVAKKSKPVAPSGTRQIPAPTVVANTPEWRGKVNAELDARGRGARADLTRHLKEKHPTFSSGQLTEILGPDEKPGQKRYSQYIPEIEAYLWPRLMPLSPDTGEVKYLIEGIANLDKNLVRLMVDLDPDEQHALAQFILATRKPK